MSIIIKAAQFAEVSHRGQLRKYTQAPYISHPARVAARISYQKWATEQLVCVGWLHDVIEDCEVSYDQLLDLFGAEIAWDVDSLTNPKSDCNRRTRKEANRIRLSQASQNVQRIKLIDRLDNLQEMDYNDRFWQVYREETMALANTLKQADPQTFKEIMEICLSNGV